MDKQMIFQTNRFIIRNIELSDAERLFRLWSNKDVTQYMSLEPLESIDQAIVMIEYLHYLYEQHQALRFAIIMKSSGALIGTCGWHEIDEQAKRCEIGYELEQKHWGKGFMKEILQGILLYSFDSCLFNRIQAKVNPKNQRSIRLLKHFGFKKEGRLRDFEWKQGHFRDLDVYSLLKKEYQENKMITYEE